MEKTWVMARAKFAGAPVNLLNLGNKILQMYFDYKPS